MSLPARLALFPCFLFLSAAAARGDSQFAANGPGVCLDPTHVRGWSMGRLSVALDDTLRLGFANPASPGGFREVSMSAVYLADRRAARDENGEVFFTSSGFPLFELLIPFGSRFAVGFGYEEMQDMGTARTKIPFDGDEGNTEPYTRFFERRGALFRVPGLLAFRFFDDVRFGVRLDTYFFNIEEDYDLVFDDASIRSSRERLLLGGSGVGGSAGLQLPLFGTLRLGLVYATPAILRGDREKSGVNGTIENTGARLGVPARGGVGLSLKLGGSWTIGLEGGRADWGDVRDTLAALGGYADVEEYAAGVERAPGRFDPWFLRFPLRAGFRVGSVPVKREEGRKIDRWSVTAGSGFSLGVHRSACDFGFEYGVIGGGGGGLREEYYRFVIGFTGQEPWRRRKSYIE